MNIRLVGVKALRKFGLSRYLNLYPKILVGNKKTTIPILRGIGEENLNISEQWMLDLFMVYRSRFEKGAFWDVGFNVGQTLIKYRTIFNDTKYLGFDPNPVCAFYVRELIQSNAWKNTDIISVGLAKETAILELFFYEKGDVDSSASMIRDFRANKSVKQIFRIPVFDLQSMNNLEGFTNSIRCIKIDVEGGELEVIQSCIELIKSQRPLVLLEILPAYKETNYTRISRQLEVERLFKELNYSCWLVIKNKKNRLANLEKIVSIGVNNDINNCDYIYLPEEETSTFRTGE